MVLGSGCSDLLAQVRWWIGGQEGRYAGRLAGGPPHTLYPPPLPLRPPLVLPLQVWVHGELDARRLVAVAVPHPAK